MDIGTGLPATMPQVEPRVILDWAQRAVSGPFSSLGVIDRAVYPNFEPLISLAAAAVTERIRLMTTGVLALLWGGLAVEHPTGSRLSFRTWSAVCAGPFAIGGTPMRRTNVFVSFLVLAFAVVLASPVTARLAAQEATPTTDDPAAAHAAFKQALQAGDPDAITALFALDGIVVSPLGTFRGPEEIRAFFAGLIENTPGLKVTFTEPTVAHNTAVSRDPVAADPYREAGAERIILIHTIVVSGGHIVVLTAIPAPDDPVTTELFAAMQAAGAPAAATPAS